MEVFKIRDYLRDFNFETHRGVCRSCEKAVSWTSMALASHKRASCTTASAEEKTKFARRNQNGSPANFRGSRNRSESSSMLADDQTEIVTSKLNSLLSKPGASFQIVDSDVFKHLVQSLNPAFAKSLPTSKLFGKRVEGENSTSGNLSDSSYSKFLRITFFSLFRLRASSWASWSTKLLFWLKIFSENWFEAINQFNQVKKIT